MNASGTWILGRLWCRWTKPDARLILPPAAAFKAPHVRLRRASCWAGQFQGGFSR
jgi:hypothetical protein